jgi:molecular chaperone DnaJ
MDPPMARTDFYETLGVAQDVGGGDLKLAYRALALRYHPDRNPGDAAAEARFKEISEAFAVLRDPARRAAYDRHGPRRLRPHGTGRRARVRIQL